VRAAEHTPRNPFRVFEHRHSLAEIIELDRAIAPVGASNLMTIRMSRSYAKALYRDPAATLDELREAVTTLEDAGKIGRRVLGGLHPIAKAIEHHLGSARTLLRARKTLRPGNA